MTKKGLTLFLTTVIFGFLILSYAHAGFTIEKKAVNDVIATELTIPAKYDVTIHNEGPAYGFEFVTLVDATILPKEMINIPSGQSSTVPVSFLPNYRVKYNFYYEYFVRDNFGNSIKDNLYVQILPLSQIVSIQVPKEIARNDVSLPIQIVNKENIDLGNVVVFVESDPITASTTIAVPANTAVTVNVPLGNTKLKVTEAGAYSIKVKLLLNNEYNYTLDQYSTLKEYSEITEETKISRNFFGYVKTITRKNNGNIKQLITVDYKYANFIEKSFTSFNIEPNLRETSKSTWQKQLAPGETLTIIADTNYTIPIVIVIVLVIAVIAYIMFKKRKVIVSKKALRIRTKGGEFAVKIVLLLKNISNKEVSNLNLVDRLPLTTRLYEKFGSVRPDETDKHRLTWRFPALLPGEEIVTSYIIYSKINMVGTIELPSAALNFTGDKGKKHSTTSNKLLINAGN
jgi:hypothetical protein